jgi:hypothetical protein
MPATSQLWTLVTEAVTEIQALSLSGVTNTNIVTQVAPSDRENWMPGFPGIAVTPGGSFTFPGGTNRSDDIGYPVGVLYVDSVADNPSFNADAAFTLLDQLIQHFIHNRLTVALPSGNIMDQWVEGLSPIELNAWRQRNQFVDGFVVRVLCRVPRRGLLG